MAKQKTDEVILQFFEDYDMEVTIHPRDDRGIKNDSVVLDSFVLTGKLKAPKNITILSKELFEKAKAESKPFKGWLESEKLVILDEVPSSYYDAKEIAANAQAKVAEAEGKLSKADKELKAKDDEIAKLKAELKAYGAK